MEPVEPTVNAPAQKRFTSPPGSPLPPPGPGVTLSAPFRSIVPSTVMSPRARTRKGLSPVTVRVAPSSKVRSSSSSRSVVSFQPSGMTGSCPWRVSSPVSVLKVWAPVGIVRLGVGAVSTVTTSCPTIGPSAPEKVAKISACPSLTPLTKPVSITTLAVPLCSEVQATESVMSSVVSSVRVAMAWSWRSLPTVTVLGAEAMVRTSIETTSASEMDRSKVGVKPPKLA